MRELIVKNVQKHSSYWKKLASPKHRSLPYTGAIAAATQVTTFEPTVNVQKTQYLKLPVRGSRKLYLSLILHVVLYTGCSLASLHPGPTQMASRILAGNALTGVSSTRYPVESYFFNLLKQTGNMCC